MNENQENALVERAKNWLIRLNRRTDKEIDAYLDGVQDALMAVYQDGYHGAYPASHMYDVLSDMVEKYLDKRDAELGKGK